MTVKIRGKDYVTVNERVLAAHAEGDFEMVGNDIITIGATGRWWCQVTIRYNNKLYMGTAEIKFDARANTADAEAPVECAETSAVGRALAFAGFGAAEGIASADEIRRSSEPTPARAPHQQERQPAVNDLAKQPAPAADQIDLAHKLKAAELDTVQAVMAFTQEHIGRKLDARVLRTGGTDLTMGEASKLLLELNKRANAQQKAGVA